MVNETYGSMGAASSGAVPAQEDGAYGAMQAFGGDGTVYDLAHQAESSAAYDLGHDECGNVSDGNDAESEI